MRPRVARGSCHTRRNCRRWDGCCRLRPPWAAPSSIQRLSSPSSRRSAERPPASSPRPAMTARRHSPACMPAAVAPTDDGTRGTSQPSRTSSWRARLLPLPVFLRELRRLGELRRAVLRDHAGRSRDGHRIADGLDRPGRGLSLRGCPRREPPPLERATAYTVHREHTPQRGGRLGRALRLAVLSVKLGPTPLRRRETCDMCTR